MKNGNKYKSVAFIFLFHICVNLFCKNDSNTDYLTDINRLKQLVRMKHQMKDSKHKDSDICSCVATAIVCVMSGRESNCP